MITVEEIRAKYPNPSLANLGVSATFIEEDIPQPDDYCVGGALCLTMGYSKALCFPETKDLAFVLYRANTGLPLYLAAAYAERIICNNDKGNFALAWETLGEALAYRRPDQESEASEELEEVFA
jgi:hypothetical protein